MQKCKTCIKSFILLTKLQDVSIKVNAKLVQNLYQIFIWVTKIQDCILIFQLNVDFLCQVPDKYSILKAEVAELCRQSVF
jgi:hypothetical protein